NLNKATLICPFLLERTRGYVVWLNRADRERLHASTRDYGVAEIDTDLQEKCELCAQANATSPTSVPGGPKMEEKVQSEDSKSEGRERRERQTADMGLRVRASNRRRRGGVRGTDRLRPLGQTRDCVG